MTTKTDTSAVRELKDKYSPKTRGILTKSEIDLIQNTLEIQTRTDIELQNIRDVTVILYGQYAGRHTEKGEHDEAMACMDAMSGICGVIDREKVKRGMPV